MKVAAKAAVFVSVFLLFGAGQAAAAESSFPSIIGFRAGTSRLADRALLYAHGATAIRYLGGAAPVFSATVAAPESLRWLSPVRYVSPNGSFFRTALTPAPTNEPELPGFWWLQPPTSTAGVGIDAVDAWSLSTGSGVTVAVLDSGIDPNHPDLAANLWTNPNEIANNGVDDDGDGIVDDVHGANMLTRSGDPTGEFWHGTHVAGIIAAVGNNGFGTVGVAYNAKIMPVRVMDDSGAVSYSDAVAGIYYAIKHGAKIINLSWGGYQTTPALYQAIVDAGKAGVLVVCAAGNDGKDNDATPVYPASYKLPNLISVAATDAKGKLASFTNYGKTTADIAAPGDKIAGPFPNDQYAYASGTSMAAPMVSGVAALLLQLHPSATPGQLKRAILGGADYVASLGNDLYAPARLDAVGAINALEQPDLIPPSVFHRLLPRTTAFKLKYTTNERFRWSAAKDPELAGYTLMVDGKEKRALGPTVTTTTLVLPRGRHTWSVVAYDRSTNERGIR